MLTGKISAMMLGLFVLCSVLSSCSALEVTTGNWSVGTCIALRMSGQFTIYPDVKDLNKTLLVEVPSDAKASGSCQQQENVTNQTERINLGWQDMDQVYNKPLDRFLNLTFMLNDTAASPYYGVYRMEGLYETRYFDKNITDEKTNKTKLETFIEYVSFTTYERAPLELQTPVNMSYMCQDMGTFSMHSELHDTSEGKGASGQKLNNVTFTATNVMLNAFRPANMSPGQFQAALDCSYRPSDVVPIIVGCALAGTVLLVLVAYLVGRRRNRAAGYQSV